MSNMVVQTNVMALSSHRNLKNVSGMQQKAAQKLSSGYRINNASDDAAGLAISEKMRSQIRGLDMASKNVSDAVSLIKTAEGGMASVDEMVIRIRELVDYAANDTNENNNTGTGDRQKIQDEINELVKEIDEMSERVEYNKKTLLNGSFQDTRTQLANATDLKNQNLISKTTAQTKYDALLASLNGDGNVTGARAELISAEANLLCDTDTYKLALQSFTEAEITYNTQLNEYNNSKTELQELMHKNSIGSITDLDTSKFTSGAEGTLSAEGAVLAAAIARYTVAAAALGMDELKVGTHDGVQGLDVDVATLIDGAVTGISNAALLDFDTALNALTEDVYTSWGDVSKDISGVTSSTDVGLAGITAGHADSAGMGIGLFQFAKEEFDAADLAYKLSIAARDTAQDKYNQVQTELEGAWKGLSSANTKYNASDISYMAAQKLSDANSSKSLHFQVGANANQSLMMSIGSFKSDTLGIGDGNGRSWINVVKDSGQDITATLDVLDQALSYVTTERSKLGAAQNRMEYTQKSLDITSENISDAESRIRDTDMAKEMMNSTKANVLQQVGVSMLAQANQAPQSVLQLLR